MKLPAIVIAVIIVVMAMAGLLAPDRLFRILEYSTTSIGLYVVTALRVVIGLVLLLVASASRTPKTLRVFGVIALIAGIATPFLGVQRAAAIRDWAIAQGPSLIRLWAGIALAFGIFILYSVISGRRAT